MSATPSLICVAVTPVPSPGTSTTLPPVREVVEDVEGPAFVTSVPHAASTIASPTTAATTANRAHRACPSRIGDPLDEPRGDYALAKGPTVTRGRERAERANWQEQASARGAGILRRSERDPELRQRHQLHEVVGPVVDGAVGHHEHAVGLELGDEFGV